MTRTAVPILLSVLLLTAVAAATDWPTLRQNLQRTGYTPDDPPAPYEPKWVRADLVPENILCWVEPIVADGRVYLGTGAGNVYALDRRDGRTLWKRELGSPVMHSVAWADGRIFTGVQGDWAGAFVAALDAATGEVLWKTPTPQGGFWTAPAVSDGLVMLGDRAGVFYAFDAQTGEIRWRIETGGPILSTAAVKDGKVFFASEDMHAYAVDVKTGEPLWRSDRLEGRTFRGYSPVLWRDKVVLRTATTIIYAAYEVEGQLMYYGWAGWPTNYQGLVVGVDPNAVNPAFMEEWRSASDEDKSRYTYGAVGSRKWDYFTPDRVQRENEAYREKLRQHEALRTGFLLDQADGIQRAVLPVNYASGCACTPVPPAVDGEDNLWVIFKSFYSNWDVPIRAHDAIGIYDLDGETIRLVQFEPRDPKANAIHTVFHITADETNHLTVAGNTLWNQHGTNGSRGWYVGAMDIPSRQFTYGVGGEGNTYPNLFGVARAPGAGSSGQVGGTVVSDGQVFNLVSGVLTCIGPKDGQAVQPFQGERAEASFDVPMPAPEHPAPEAPAVTVEQLVGQTWQPGEIGGEARELAEPVRRRLNEEVARIIESGPWAPLRIEGGQCIDPLLSSGSQFYFGLPSETIAALAVAYPYLDEPLQQRVRQYAAMEWERFRPWGTTVYTDHDRGTRYGSAEGDLRHREPYALGHWLYGPYPQYNMPASGLSGGRISPIVNHYAIWLYGQNLGQWDAVRAAWDQMKRDFAAFADSGFSPERNQAGLANWYASGLVGYARIARHFGEDAEAQKAQAQLQRLLDARVAIEQGLEPASKTALHRGMYSRACPEVWRYLAGQAAPQMHRQLAPDLFGVENTPRTISLFHAWGVGPHESRHHEAYVIPPSTVWAAFQAQALLYGVPAGQLRDECVDLPWTPADLYYVHKLALTLDRFADAQWRQ